MSDSDEEESFVFEPLTKNKSKEKRKKGMTEQRRAQLLLNLAKGRETSRLNRMKKGKAKKIIKAQKKDEIDEIIEKDLKKKNRVAELEDKLRLMEEKLAAKESKKKQNLELSVISEEEEEEVFDEIKKEIISKKEPVKKEEIKPKKNLTPLQLWRLKQKKKK